MGDIVIALRHQPALLAYSSKDGRRLWCYAPEFSRAQAWGERQPAPWWFGTVVGKPLVVPDLDGDGVVDFIVGLLVLRDSIAAEDRPSVPIPLKDQPQRSIDAISGKTGKQIWQYELDDRWFDLPVGTSVPLANRWFAAPPTSQTGGMDWQNPFGQYTDCPIPVAEDIDGDGKPEILLQECVQKSPQDYVFRCRVLEGPSGKPRWSHESPTQNMSMFPNGGIELGDRPRPLVIRRGETERAIVLWDWGAKLNPGQDSANVILLNSKGEEFWRFPVSVSGPPQRTFRVRKLDVTDDGRDELVLVNGNAVECLDIIKRERLWQYASVGTRGTTILDVSDRTGSHPPIIEVLSEKSVTGLSGVSGKPLWICAGLPVRYEPPSQYNISVLRHGQGEFPPAFLVENSAGGDSVCLQATPSSDSPFTAYRTPATVTPARDPRFVRYLPWQSSDFWPFNSPAWIATGLLFFLPTLVVLPSWSLYKIIWQRRWSLQFWLLLPLVVLLFLIALATPNPGDTPQISPLNRFSGSCDYSREPVIWRVGCRFLRTTRSQILQVPLVQVFAKCEQARLRSESVGHGELIFSLRNWPPSWFTPIAESKNLSAFCVSCLSGMGLRRFPRGARRSLFWERSTGVRNQP